jgi:hypothetical protein
VFDNKQKRMLACDGGGILGIISLGALREIERQLREITGEKDLRLNQFFDYFAGTSTGGIIAAGLALGMDVEKIESIYMEEGPDIFDKRGLFERAVTRLRSKYSHKKLTKRLKKEFSDKSIYDLQESKLLSREKHLMIVTRNIETDSPWPISTNPKAKYNDINRADCNLQIPLWQLVRASTAAPTFFDPERLQWDSSDPDKQFFFEDGGVTPHNNPAFLLYKMATGPEYSCGWETGEEKLMMISVGTSYNFRLMPTPHFNGETLVKTAATIPSELMRGFAMDVDHSCRTIGRCVAGPILDGEVGNMIPAPGNETNRKFLYARYDVETSQKNLEEMGLNDISPADLALDNVEASADMKRIGEQLGKQVDLRNQFAPFLKGFL